MAKRKADLKNEILRLDGRPEVADILADYDNPDGPGYSCAWCEAEGQLWKKYKKVGEIYLSAVMLSEGTPAMICNAHLPDNTVIVNIKDSTCRNKQGNEVWSANVVQ